MATAPASYHTIVEVLRQRILDGELQAFDRLPTYAQLQSTFSTTRVTVQRAIAMLESHGYVATEERRGIFVAAHPPHLSHFAIAYPWSADHPQSLFFQAIQDEVAKRLDPERRMSSFFGIQYHSDDEDLPRLRECLRTHRLAGVILAHAPAALLDRQGGSGTPVPCVSIQFPELGVRFPTVYPDLVDFRKKAFAFLAKRGRKRVAVAMMDAAESPSVLLRMLQREADPFGLVIQPHWVHGFILETARWANPVMNLLFHKSHPDRPDGLVIADDNFIEPVTAGVAASGIEVPRELDVVAMANYPLLAPSALPVTRLGFDIPRLVSVCLERIEQQRCGKTFPAHTDIPAEFEGSKRGT